MFYGRVSGGRIAAATGTLLLAGAVWTSGAPAEHNVLEQVSSGNAATGATFAGASADGTRAFFRTTESLGSADTDSSIDFYERTAGGPVLVSTGAAAVDAELDALPRAISADGARAVFTTQERLLPAQDTDDKVDIYERTGGQTKLLSRGTTGGNGDVDAIFDAAASDGSRVIFSTTEQLTGADADTAEDVYQSAGGTTTLLSPGTLNANAQYQGASADAQHVVILTGEKLRPADDTDIAEDLYDLSGGQTALASFGPAGGNAGFAVGFRGISADGSTIVMFTGEQWTADDTNGVIDLYARRGGQTARVSQGPTSGGVIFPLDYRAMTPDGSHIYFETPATLVAGDTDAATDLYDRSGGATTTLVSTGGADLPATFGAAADDGSRVVFSTEENLTSDDVDGPGQADLYERAGGLLALVSRGPDPATSTNPAFFAGASKSLSRVFFTTASRLVAADTEGAGDVYERAGGETTLISDGTAVVDALFNRASDNGSRVFFTTAEKLLAGDTDAQDDVYVKRIPAPVNQGPPLIAGSAVAGQTLACAPGTWSDSPAFAYRWNRDGAAIAGATGSSYAIASADVGHVLTCTVTGSNDGGSASATSAGVTPVAAQGPPPPPGGGGLLPGACANVKAGTGKRDVLTGTRAGDRLTGRGGNDTLRGLGGADCLSGGGGKDTLSGGSGKDRLTGGKGVDKLAGGTGNDVIDSRDGKRETVRCGKGKRDRVKADRKDRLRGCEKVRRR